MAWVGQCRVAFKCNADALLLRQQSKKKSINKVLKQLNDESGIPLRTLQRWWQEECANNGAIDLTASNNTESSAVERHPPVPTCKNCKKNPCETYKKRNGEMSYRGFCVTCRDTKDLVRCPECDNRFKIKDGRVHYEQCKA